MRIRYGKPIKVKSLVGNQTTIVFHSISGWGTNAYRTVGNGEYLLTNGVGLKNYGNYFRDISLDSTHKYLFIRLDSERMNNNAEYSVNINGSLTNHTDMIKPSNTNYTLVRFTGVSEFIGWESYNYSSTAWSEDAYPVSFSLIDLTETFGSGNEPTAQQFYNKYSRFFPLIAAGNEITLDDKAGQVSLKPELPNTYQQVEYIHSDSNVLAYINTQCPIFKYDSWEIRVRVRKGSQFLGDYQSIWNSTYDSNTFEAWITTSADNNLNVRYNGVAYRNLCILTENKTHDFITRHTGTKIIINVDGQELVNSDSSKTTIDVNSVYLTIGHSNDGTSFKYYEVKLFGNGELLRHLIPCFRKSDNIIGMYDLVNDIFYTNQGMGLFVKGPNVNTLQCEVAGGSSDIYYGYNQLAINGDFANGKTSWDDWNSTTVVINGVAEITRTNTSQSSLHQDISANPGDKIYVRATMWSDGTTPTRLGLNGGISWSGTPTTSTTPILFEVIKPVVPNGNGCRIELFGTGVANTKYYAKEVNAINLTTWFGAGKEPSTVVEFKEKFTKEYYGTCITPIKLTRYQIEALPNYGYNQVFKIGSGNGCARTYGDNGEFILTADSSTTHTYFGLTCYGENYNLDSIKGHKALCIAKVTEISISSFTALNFTWALSDITDRRNITEPGIIYGIGTWGTANQTFLNASRSSGTFTQGDYFKVTNVQIIDLTDWYGAGSEPTTLEEFKQTFPNLYYPYSKKRLLNKYMINNLKS